jgi:4-deoxy-L-threo-5-hexosulose-uronate ketol-isomerase
MTMVVNTRQVIGPDDAAKRDTQGLRDAFLISDLFLEDQVNMTYSHLDRVIVGGVVPKLNSLVLNHVKETGTAQFLQRREAAIVNIGGQGKITVGGVEYVLGFQDVLYVGMGAGTLLFTSHDVKKPSHFYVVSAPAHRSFPTKLITLEMAKKVHLGSSEEANARTINQYVHPEVCESCQLLLGLTMFELGSIWNTMPAHVHDRRMEVYLYFDMHEDARVFHFMGTPEETRHLVLKNHDAVLSPGWSIHSGAGTGRYSFIWAMAGDNMDFTDMDKVPTSALK